MDTKLLVCLLLLAALATAQIPSNATYKKPCVAFQSGVLPQHHRMPAVLNQQFRLLDMLGLRSVHFSARWQWWMHPDCFPSAYSFIHLELANLAYLQQVSANYGDLRFESINLA